MNPKYSFNRTNVALSVILSIALCAAVYSTFKHWKAVELAAELASTMVNPAAANERIENSANLLPETANRQFESEPLEPLAVQKPTNALPDDSLAAQSFSDNNSARLKNQNPAKKPRVAKLTDRIKSEPTLLTTAIAAARPTAGGEAEENKTDKPFEALQFRDLQRQDENGKIPPDGLQKARKQMDRMRARQQRLARAAGKPEGEEIAGLEPGQWLWLGPGNVGGRVRSIVIDPANANNMWAGSVAGGIWRTDNAGALWTPLNSFMANLAVSTMVIDPTNANIIYAGTGESFAADIFGAEGEGFTPDGLRGEGIFKSTDGGATWNQLPQTSPSDPAVCANGAGVSCAWSYVNRLSIASDGSAILAATVRGVRRSTDGGVTWTAATGGGVVGSNIQDVSFNRANSQLAIASGSGRSYYSTNGGQNWLAANFPAGFTAERIETAYAPSDANIVYASVDRNQGEVYRSADGGQNFVLVNSGTNFLGTQGNYDNIIWVNPQDSAFVIIGGIDLWRSTDSGATFTRISDWAAAPVRSAHADNHMIVEHPAFNNTTNRTVYFSNDGGMYRADNVATVSLTSGWTNLNNNLGVTQFYGAAANSNGVVVGGTQDNGNLRFSDNPNAWQAITGMGGDGGYVAADPTDPNYFYGEYIYLQIKRSTNGGTSGSDIFSGIADAGDKAPNPQTANFIAPFVLDPNDPNRMLAGGISLWRSSNVKAAAPTWTAIKAPVSNDLIPPSNIPISAIAVSPNNPDFIVVGHNNGQLFFTTDGTAAAPVWNRMDNTATAVPNRFVTRIVIDSTKTPNWVYAAFGGFAADNIYRTVDLGATWTDASGTGATGLPDVPVRALTINPIVPQFIYAGTEVGTFASEDAGATWQLPQDGPANISVDELIWRQGKLVAVTHGRGLYESFDEVFNVTICTVPPTPCECLGYWNCPCGWAGGRIPNATDDIGLYCSITIDNPGASVRNMRNETYLSGRELGVAGTLYNAGFINNAGVYARNIINSRFPNAVGNTGVIQSSGVIHATGGEMINAGFMAARISIEAKNLRTTPDSTMVAASISVTGNLENYGLIQAEETQPGVGGGVNVNGDIFNQGSLKGVELAVGRLNAPLARTYSGSGLWKFRRGGGITDGYTLNFASDVTYDIDEVYMSGTLNLNSRTLTLKGNRFTGYFPMINTGTIKFAPTGGTATFAGYGPAVTIASGTIEKTGDGALSGLLTVDAGATLAFNSQRTAFDNDVIVNGALTNIGGGTPLVVFNGTTFTNNGLVGNLSFFNFNNSGTPRNQRIVGAGTWEPRSIGIGSGGTTPSFTTVTLENDLTFAGGTLSVVAGSLLNINDRTLTLAGAVGGGQITSTGLVRMQPINSTTAYLGNQLTITPNVEIISGIVAGSQATLNGNLTINAVATLSVYGGGIRTNGNVTNKGTINSFDTTSSIGFAGGTFTNNGSITGNARVNFGTLPSQLQNLAGTGSWTNSGWLIFGSTANVNLQNNLLFDGANFAVDGGRLNTGAFTLSLPCSVAWIGAGEVFGNVRRTNLAACPGATFAFGNPFTTIRFTSGTPPTEINVNVLPVAPNGFRNAVRRTYLITPTGGSNYAATLRLHYLDSELGSNTESALNLWRNNGSDWTLRDATSRNATQNWVEYTGVTEFSPWAISSATAPTAASVSVGGRVTTANGRGIGNARITLTNSNGETRTTASNAFGYFRFAAVAAGETYIFSASAKNHQFGEPTQVRTIVGETDDLDFTAVAPVANEPHVTAN